MQKKYKFCFQEAKALSVFHEIILKPSILPPPLIFLAGNFTFYLEAWGSQVGGSSDYSLLHQAYLHLSGPLKGKDTASLG